MFFRVPGNPDAEVCGNGLCQRVIQVLTVVHASDLFYQFTTILVSAFFGSKETFSRYGITPEGHHVFNVKEIQVDEFVFDLVAGSSPAHDMRNHVHVVPSHDGGGQCHGTGTFRHGNFFNRSVRVFTIYHFISVKGDVDEWGSKGNQGFDSLVYFIDISTF